MDGVARTFRGLTAPRLALFCAVVLFIALHSPPTIFGVLLAKTWTGMLIPPVRSFFLSLLVFTPVLLAVTAVENRGPRTGAARIACLVLALIGGHIVGALLAYAVQPLVYAPGDLPPLSRNPDVLLRLRVGLGRGVWNLMYSATALVLYLFLKKSNTAAAAVHREEMRREAMQRENAEARLQVMQAQIEPHFLFNTLASVRALYRTDRAAGRAMLQHLSSYLAASLPSMRQPRSTLEREVALATAYLSVHKIRMGDRLDFEIDVPVALCPQFVPPMMIATLVENAVIHGLSPVPAGGRIRVTARELHGKLIVDVIDDGRGLQGTWGGGVGLANIRSRLASEFGSQAQLTLVERAEGGVIATVEIPLARMPMAEAA